MATKKQPPKGITTDHIEQIRNDYFDLVKGLCLLSINLVRHQAIIESVDDIMGVAPLYKIENNTSASSPFPGYMKGNLEFKVDIVPPNGDTLLGQISGTLEARYRIITKNFSQEVFDLFSRNNLILNLWPYAREIVQSDTSRMGIQPIALPLTKFGIPPKN